VTAGGSRQAPTEAPFTVEEKVIGGIHAKLLLGKGRFTRDEADVLLQAHDRLRALVVAQRDVVAALEKIADSPCTPNMDGECVGAVHSRRKRYDNPDRVEVVGCAKHFAAAALAVSSSAPTTTEEK
jgi:hypothetical protein